MVLDFYKLVDQPFGVTPDPRFLYLGHTHREALANVLNGVTAGRGFTALIAGPGMGKTTLLWHLLERLRDTARTAFLFQSQRSPREFLMSFLADLGIENAGDGLGEMRQKLNEALLRESKSARPLVVVIDEAENLAEPTLELLNMLSSFEAPREKLIQVLLAGRPQFAEKLGSPRLIQIRQRISILALLEPFNAEETRLYIDHRLRLAGYDFVQPLFTESALALITRNAEGVPRNINNVCFNALALGCAKRQETIDADVIEEVLTDLNLQALRMVCGEVSEVAESSPSVPSMPKIEPVRPGLRGWPLRFGLALCIVLMVLLGWTLLSRHKHIAPALSSKIPQAGAKIASAPSLGTPGTDQKLSVGTTSTPKTPLAAAPPSRIRSTTDVHTDGTRAVTVLPGQTLYRICINNLGRYDDEVLGRIRALNPGLIDPTQIKVGQTILLPGIRPTSTQIQSPVRNRIQVNSGKKSVPQ